jgi:hypothetical protein
MSNDKAADMNTKGEAERSLLVNTPAALAAMMREAQWNSTFREQLMKRGIPFGALSSALTTLAAERDRFEAERDALNARLRTCVKSALRAQRLHDENAALREALKIATDCGAEILTWSGDKGMVRAIKEAQRKIAALSHPSAPSPVVPACRAEAVCETCRNHPNGVMRPVEGVIRPVPCPDCTPSAKEKM